VAHFTKCLLYSNFPLFEKKIYVVYSTYKNSPISGLDRPRGFQEVKVPRFHDNGTEWW